MAIQPSDLHPSKIFFTSAAEDEETFKVIRFAGEESISTPYHFEIDLASDNPDIDIQRMVSSPVRLTIQKDGDPRHIHGVLKTFRQGNEGRAGHYFYHAVLVPRLWLMNLSRQNQIYQNQTVPEIIKAELMATQSKGASVGMDGSDFEFRLTQNYAKREYVVQYAESDFNFISRLMEHEGIFYFFEQDRQKEKLVITDNNIHLQAIAGNSRLSYRQASGLSSNAQAAVRDFTCQRQQIPGHIVLKDYNYRLPHLPLQAEAMVDEASHGLVCNYGEHFKVPEEGQALATVRSQEIRARQTIYQGQADGIHFSAGGKFYLEEHFRGSYNREYILTAVHHEGQQMLSGIADQAPGQPPETDYRNRFEAITADVAFRPPRVTPKPRLTGIMNAHVDAGLLEDRAEIDDQGRYKVVMPFDLSGQAGGKATRFIRMAQPYGGHSQGMHFPLRKNTEVIWTCIDGDPDRPIIIGTVPNPMTPSVVNSDNYTRNIVKTAHGSFLEFNDGRGNGGQNPSSLGQASLQQQQHFQQAATRSTAVDSSSVPQTTDQRLAEPSPVPADAAPGRDGDPRHLAPQQQLQSDNDTYKESDTGDGHDVWFRVNVPRYDTVDEKARDSYLRLGKSPSPNEEKAYDIIQPLLGNPSDESKKRPDGWLDHTDGDHATMAMGDRKIVTGGNREEIINGTSNLTIGQGGNSVYDAQAFYNVSWHKSFGNTWTKYETQFLSELTFTGGQSTNLYMGTKADATLGATVNFDVGVGVNLGAVMRYDNVLGPVINVSQTTKTKARKSIILKVKAKEDEYAEMKKATMLLAGIAATAVGIQATAGFLSTSDWLMNKNRAWLGAASSTAIPLAAAAMVLGAYAKFRQKNRKSEPNTTQIQMTNDTIEINNVPLIGSGTTKKETIELKCGKSSIVMHADGYIEINGENIQFRAKESLRGLSNKISLASGSTGKTSLSGNQVTVHSSNKTTISSKMKTDIEGNMGVNIGGPDTKSVKIKQEEFAAIKQRNKHLRIRESKSRRPA